MFRSITFNGTDKKQIGAPIIRRTNEMISEFDLQYERNYKIVKIISQRELEFQEYLKEQEARQYRLDNLIKILRGYFKENNYNENTYYALFKPSKRKSIRRRRKRKKKVRPKTAEIKRNKYLFYKVTRNNYIFNKFKPYLYPLTNKEKKDIERKIYTDANLKEKSKGSLNNMSPAQLKQFVDVFGFIPMVFHKEDQDKEKKGNKFKILKNHRNFSSNVNNSMTSIGASVRSIRNKNNKNLLSINMKRRMIGRLMKSQNNFMFNNMNSINSMTNVNNSNSYNNFIKNIIESNKSLNFKKNSNKNNILLTGNKYLKNNILNNNNAFNIFKSNKLNSKIFKMNPMDNNSYNSIFYNNRYFNNQNYNNNPINNSIMGFISSKSINKINNLNNINSPKISLFSTKSNNNINTANSNDDGKIKIKKNNIENLKKYSFSNQCIKAIQKSEILNKDILYLNKEYDITGENFNAKTNKLEDKTLRKANYLSMIEIFQKDFKPDIKKELNKKYEHIKEDLNGRIHVKKIEFLRRPKSRLNFVRIYNKRREQKNQNKIEFGYNNNDEEKSDLTAFKIKRDLGRIKLNRNLFKKNKYKYLPPSSIN